MRGVPGSVGAAGAVKVSEHGGAVGAAGPIVAGVIGGVGERATVRRRTGEHVVLVGHVADTVYFVTLFAEGRGLGESVANAGLIQGVAVEIANVRRDAVALRAEPGAVTDAVTGVDGGLAAFGLRAEVGVPGEGAAGCGGQLLAAGVGACDATEIASFTATGTGDEETHGLRRLFALGSLSQCQRRADRKQSERAEYFFHMWKSLPG